MPTPLFRSLCLPVTLHNAWKVVKSKNSAGGIDGFSVTQFEERLAENLAALREELIAGKWNPEPYLRVEIPKKEKEVRKLGLLSVRDKIVQQAIKTLIEPKLEKIFLNNSYGYRPGKGPARAIHRVMNIYRQMKQGYVAKLDIDDYFDTIRHERLFIRLQNFLNDDEIVRLVKLCVQMGVVTKRLKWSETDMGVPQGAVLSPLLANFYLHPFDRFVSSKTPNYVRYADDFLIVAEKREALETIINEIQIKLKSDFSLKLNPPIISDLETGTEFLGIYIRRTGLSLSEKKKKDLEQRIDSIEWQDIRLSEKSKETVQGIRNYYAKLLPQPVLKELDIKFIAKIHEWIKQSWQSIRNKTELTNSLHEIFFFADETNLAKPFLIKEWITAYLGLSKKETKSEKKTDNKLLIRQKKREYQKREGENSELIITSFGTFIGKNNKGISVKVQNKVATNAPSRALEHITILTNGVTISSDAVWYCMENNIPIDFFSKSGKHYASVLSPLYIEQSLWKAQSLLSIKQNAYLASRIVLGKLKNQVNLIKYFHKYHKEGEEEPLHQKYVEATSRIDDIIAKVKKFDAEDDTYRDKVMGYEAAGAVQYWAYIAELTIDDAISFQSRVRRGADDPFNSLLNYGYALLYPRVWQAVLKNKLNPSMGVMHAFQAGKPTLVYDLIELFRAQAVDRVVIGLVQKAEPLSMDQKLLSEATKKLLVKNILERLNRYEKYRGNEIKFTEIIKRQVKEYADYVHGKAASFKPYIAKW